MREPIISRLPSSLLDMYSIARTSPANADCTALANGFKMLVRICKLSWFYNFSYNLIYLEGRKRCIKDYLRGSSLLHLNNFFTQSVMTTSQLIQFQNIQYLYKNVWKTSFFCAINFSILELTKNLKISTLPKRFKGMLPH